MGRRRGGGISGGSCDHRHWPGAGTTSLWIELSAVRPGQARRQVEQARPLWLAYGKARITAGFAEKR